MYFYNLGDSNGTFRNEIDLLIIQQLLIYNTYENPTYNHMGGLQTGEAYITIIL